MQRFVAIEFEILRRVDQVEARDPADHSGRQDQRRPGEPAGCRDPGPDRRDRQREPEKEMGRRGEAFRQRVEKDDRERERREQSVSRLIAARREHETRVSWPAAARPPPVCESRRWRAAVRGFRWSSDQSTIRLKSIAAVRAKTMQSKHEKKSRGVGRPCVATRSAPRANGSAKMVCEKRISCRKRATARSGCGRGGRLVHGSRGRVVLESPEQRFQPGRAPETIGSAVREENAARMKNRAAAGASAASVFDPRNISTAEAQSHTARN